MFLTCTSQPETGCFVLPARSGRPWCAARLRRLGKESEVGVPIVVEGEPWGEVYATTAPGEPRFRSEDVRFLEAVAGQLAVPIQLLRAADAALYRAKRNGGGQIFTADSRAPERAPRGERRALRRSTRDRV